MTEKELMQMIHDEEKRLGVGSNDFMKKHQEIMEQCNNLMPSRKGEKDGMRKN